MPSTTAAPRSSLRSPQPQYATTRSARRFRLNQNSLCLYRRANPTVTLIPAPGARASMPPCTSACGRGPPCSIPPTPTTGCFGPSCYSAVTIRAAHGLYPFKVTANPAPSVSSRIWKSLQRSRPCASMGCQSVTPADADQPHVECS